MYLRLSGKNNNQEKGMREGKIHRGGVVEGGDRERARKSEGEQDRERGRNGERERGRGGEREGEKERERVRDVK